MFVGLFSTEKAFNPSRFYPYSYKIKKGITLVFTDNKVTSKKLNPLKEDNDHVMQRKMSKLLTMAGDSLIEGPIISFFNNISKLRQSRETLKSRKRTDI